MKSSLEDEMVDFRAAISFWNAVTRASIDHVIFVFRDGETALIYSKVLHLLHQLSGVTCFSIYPYQLGDQNVEAIKSGAFWFYRKLGFQPGRPELLALTQREKAKMRRKAGHRTSSRLLHKLAAGHVFYETGEGHASSGELSLCEISDWQYNIG